VRSNPFLGIALAIVAPLSLVAQSEIESLGDYGTIAKYPAEWSYKTRPDSVPQWAKPGRIRFTRWDGGPIETAKAFLSGWAGFNPPNPDRLYVMTNWYDPSTVALLCEADFNTVWVTFSNGFSIPTEAAQREILRRYIQECHRQGIHVFAYQSVANIFWEDMYERVPESRRWVRLESDGKPVPYDAGIYSKMGRVTRYIADLANPAWLDYVKKRIDLAIDAGADGIMYDNVFDQHVGKAFQEICSYASSKKKDMLIMANFHNPDFIFNRITNAITTEEGGEAGVFSESNVLNSRYKEEEPFMLRVGEGLLANNIGRFRIFQNLSEGWKPVHIESRMREVGEPETDVMSAERQQLVLAENMMFSAANETFVEGVFATRLWQHDPETMRIWHAIGVYNRFFADHEEYYTDTRSRASLAVVIDNRSKPVIVLNGLSSRNVIYDPLYEQEISAEKLRSYAAVALINADLVRDRAVKALEEYTSWGGKLIAIGSALAYDEKGSARPQPAFLRTNTGKAESVYFEKLPPIDELAQTMLAADRQPRVRVLAPKGVLFNVVDQAKAGRMIVHLLNYTLQPMESIQVWAPGRFTSVKLLTPDGHPEAVQVTVSGGMTQVQVPFLKIYSILVFAGEDKRSQSHSTGRISFANSWRARSAPQGDVRAKSLSEMDRDRGTRQE